MKAKVKRPETYLLTAKFAMPSARVLREAIEQVSGKHYLLTTKDGIARRALARYGGTATVAPGGVDTDNNSIERIRVIGHKYSFSRLLKQHNVKTVEFFGNETPPTAYPVLVRETLTSFGGRGIHVCTNAEEFRAAMRPGYYWTPFLRFSNEYRVHVMGGQVVRVFEKVREEGMPEEELPIRNAHRGYHFSIRNRPAHGQSIRAIVAEIARIPLLATGFYALDLGWVRGENGGMYVIEGNSTPGIDMPTALYYARYILTGNPFEQGEQNEQPVTIPTPVVAASTEPIRTVTGRTPTPAPVPQRVPSPRASHSAEDVRDSMSLEHMENPASEIPLTASSERRVREPEVLRTATNTQGNGVSKTGTDAGGEHKPAARRPKWSW